MDWPEWWDWELEISSHCRKRMLERSYSEAELRVMMDDATGILEQLHGTFIVETRHENVRWEVIVTPDDNRQIIVVVTAYRDC